MNSNTLTRLRGLAALIMLLAAGCALMPVRRSGVTGRLYDTTLEEASTVVRAIAGQEGLIIERDGLVKEDEWRLSAAGGRQASEWTRVYITVRREDGGSRVLIDEQHTRVNTARVLNSYAARIYAQLDRELKRR